METISNSTFSKLLIKSAYEEKLLLATYLMAFGGGWRVLWDKIIE
jgi:hypothetical protein